MIKEIRAFGKDVNEAKENARAALGVSELDDVTFEVLHIGSKGIFGIIGVKQAEVKAIHILQENRFCLCRILFLLRYSDRNRQAQ